MNCAASGMSLSDGERPRAPSFARCVGLLKGPTVQAEGFCPLRGVALDIVDLRQRVTM
jgi:hypothetical protein